MRSKKDPYLEREAAKYEKPIPSREFIIEFLNKSAGPLAHEDLCKAFGLEEEELQIALARRLKAMERDGQIVRNRRDAYGPLDKLNLVKGRVVGHPEGYGFLIPEGGGEDLYLSSRQMRRVMDGDEVVARIAGRDFRGRAEGSIVEVIARGATRLVGRYHAEAGIHFVRPDNPRISQDIMIAPNEYGAARSGQVVLVELTVYPSRNQLPAGRIIQVLGDHMAPGIEIEVAILNYGIPTEWSKAALKQVERLPDQVHEKDKKDCFDLRKKPFVTIDGEDARDFDDAVYCEKQKSGWKLYVAIADVSHYVQVDDSLDKEAYQRGTSVYFPQQVIPMLPEKLSNGLCSLNPGVDRLCMVCEMRLDEQGEVTGFWFYEGVIHSHARLTYTQVAAMIAQRDDKQSDVRQRFKAITPHVDILYSLYQQLRQKRESRGAIDFETQETRILFDAERKIEQIIPTERTDAHKLIEECMLCANVCAATLLQKSKLPALYRVHEGPTDVKLESLREFLHGLGLGLGGGAEPSPKDYQRLLENIESREDIEIIQAVVLRSMRQAVYQSENLGHFGLNYPAYTHFTSPIRRYPDLLTHRAIRHLIRSKRRIAHVRRIDKVPLLDKKKIYPYSEEWIEQAGIQASTTERRADEATRDVSNWLKCEFMLEHVGDEFDGVVVAVTGFGMFVQLTHFFIEGLVHVTGLPKDYYVHEPAHHRLVGERTRRVFALGDHLRVRVVRVSLDERKIDFELTEQTGFRSGKKPKKAQDTDYSNSRSRTPRKRAVSNTSSVTETREESRPPKRSKTRTGKKKKAKSRNLRGRKKSRKR